MGARVHKMTEIGARKALACALRKRERALRQASAAKKELKELNAWIRMHRKLTAEADADSAEEALSEYEREGGYTLEQVEAEIESVDQAKH